MIGTCPYGSILDLNFYLCLVFMIRIISLFMNKKYHHFRELQNILSLNVVDVFGMLRNTALQQLRQAISVDVNKYPFSSIARPTTGVRRTSIWGVPVRDNIL